MSFNIILPNIDRKKGSAKDYILSILGYEWPLTPKKLYFAMKKRYAFSGTYQAVFKAIKELEKEQVLQREDNGYAINMKWVKTLQSYTDMVETNYYAKTKLQTLDMFSNARKEGNLNVLTFKSYFNMEKYLYYLQKDFLLNTSTPTTIVEHHAHEWRPIFYLRTEFNFARKIIEKKHKKYLLCAGNTAVDKWSNNFYNKVGIPMKIKVPCATTCDLVVMGDHILEIYLPSSITTPLTKLLSKKLCPSTFPILIKEVFEKKADVQLVINKDKNIAKKIVTQTKKNF